MFDASIMAHAQWAVAVRSIDSGEQLYAVNAGKLMMPASAMKIVTVAGVARVLGWDHRFTTTLETTAAVEAGVLQGDLIVRGGGDPTINTRDGRGAAVFAEWAAALTVAGVREIRGCIAGDDQLFDDESLGGGWAWDDLQYGYAAPVGALQYNENTAQLTVTPGATVGDPAVLALPEGTGLSLLNRAATAPAGTPETVSYRRHLDRPVLEVTGVVPLPTPAPEAPEAPLRVVSRQVAVVNPTVYFARSLKDALIAAGIAVTGEAIDLDDREAAAAPAVAGPSSQRRVLATTTSPPVRDIARVLMKVSQNLYAESLLKAAGVAAAGAGTTAAGRAAVIAALGPWLLDPRALVMTDGSGLSRHNYVSAELLTGLLDRIYRDPRMRDEFVATLPVAGREGTVAARLKRSRAEGNAAAKTGSLANVRALAGYVRSRDGEMLAFSILANDFNIPAATVNWVADLAVEILANFRRSS